MNEEIFELLDRENVELASIAKRSFAFVIDEVIISVLFFVIYYDSFANAQSGEVVIALVNSLVLYILLLKILYQAFFVWYYGATIGKLAMKIRVISYIDVENPSFNYSLVRALLRVAGEMIFYVTYLPALFTPSKQTLHDKVAKTLVINA
jgi:uncharacterized RDD family membrane protein YckC